MPSGAKKRKAAKKKQVQQTQNPNNNNGNPNSSSAHSHGDDDVKHYDEKESDGGEVLSPASQEHHNSQHPFAEVEEEEVEKREDSSSVRLIVPKKNSIEGINIGENSKKVTTEEEGIVQIEWDMKSEEEDFKSKDISSDSSNGVHDGGSSGSSSSSSSNSDDESHVEKKTGPIVDLVKPVDSLSEVVTQVDDSITVGETDNGAAQTEPAVDSVKPVYSLSEVVSQVNSIPVGVTDNGVVETASLVEPNKVSLTEEVVQGIESASIDNPMASCVGELDLKEDVEKMLPTLDGKSGVPPVLMDLESRKKKNDVVSTTEEKAAVFLDTKESATEVHEDKLVLSFNAPNVHTSNGADYIKDSESPECSDIQPLVASAPRTVQKTSFKGCCGMFELFTGSDI